jgi:hypothetical protein
MSEETHRPDGRAEHPEVRSERSDASFRAVLAVLVAAAVAGVVTHVVLLKYYANQLDEQAEIKKSPYPLAPVPATGLPREPRLEQVDRLEGIQTPNVYKRELAKEEALARYGPTSEEGFVRIPIDRAIALTAGKLPARAAPPADRRRRAGGLTDAGDPNSGRLFRRGPR